ncbi:MAG: segregation and condensation protein B [Planctomycetota bacterium]|jgi:segregation and condensation protein B
MDDISRELPPDETGATPVSERQKGPEELQRFELGHIGDDTDDAPQFGNRLAGLGAPFLAERFLAVTTPTTSADSPLDDGPTDSPLDDGGLDGPGEELPSEHEQPDVEQGSVEAGSDSELGDSELGDSGGDSSDGSAEELPHEPEALVTGDVAPVEALVEVPESAEEVEVLETAEGLEESETPDESEASGDPESSDASDDEAAASAGAVEATDVETEVELLDGELADDLGSEMEAVAEEGAEHETDDKAVSETADGETTGSESTVEGQIDQDEVAQNEAVDGEVDGGGFDDDAAQAAVAAEANTVELDSVDDLVDSELGEDGLPIVPDLTDAADVARMVYVLMMTSREGMTVFRLARACNTSQKLVEEGLELLQSQLRGIGLPVELTRVGETVRWMSGASAFPYLQRLRGVKKLEKLSPAALETLAVIAYRQPVMRSEIEAIRGVKAGPMLRTLLQHKLVKVAGRADVPGRPLQYGTTQQFLERFGLASLQELPSVKEWKNLG